MLQFNLLYCSLLPLSHTPSFPLSRAHVVSSNTVYTRIITHDELTSLYSDAFKHNMKFICRFLGFVHVFFHFLLYKYAFALKLKKHFKTKVNELCPLQ